MSIHLNHSSIILPKGYWLTCGEPRDRRDGSFRRKGRQKEPSDCVITPFLLKGSDRGDTVSTTEYTEKAREEHGTLMTTYLWLKIYAPRLASDFLPLASSYATSVVRKVSLSSSNFQYHNRSRERRGRQARS